MITVEAILDVKWFSTGLGPLGFVAVRTGLNGWQVYAGCGAGTNERADALQIAQWGAKLPLPLAFALFPKFDPRTYDDAHAEEDPP